MDEELGDGVVAVDEHIYKQLNKRARQIYRPFVMLASLFDLQRRG